MVAEFLFVWTGEKFAEIKRASLERIQSHDEFRMVDRACLSARGHRLCTASAATVFFPAGVRRVSLFIKLLPNATRKRTALFYVVLGNTSSGSALSSASKASISLHP